MAGRSGRGFTPALILFIALPENENNIDPGWPSSRCDCCRSGVRCAATVRSSVTAGGSNKRTINGALASGFAADSCRPCRRTFTILPAWSPPYGQYSLYCRQQAWKSLRNGCSCEESVPSTQEPNKMPDSSTVRRWTAQLFSLWILLATRLGSAAGYQILGPSTILAWDWSAVRRILSAEPNSS